MEIPKWMDELVDKNVSVEEQERISKMTAKEDMEWKCERMNNARTPIYDAKIYDCEKCKNSGVIYMILPHQVLQSNGEYQMVDYIQAVQCDCKKVRDSLLLLAESGLTDTMKKETFDSYKTLKEWQANIKNKAISFIDSEASCFYIGGFTGSGKTKICSCILNEFINKKMGVRYIVWNDYVSELMTNFDLIDESIEKLQKIDILYIDDLYKFEPKDFEKKVLFRIINYRVRNGLKTLISSELKLVNTRNEQENNIAGLDLAVTGRIYEGAGKGEFVISIPNEPQYNMRFKNI